MPRRFSRIKQANRLQTAYTAYKQWEDRDRIYKERPAGSKPGGFVALQVRPFGLEDADVVRIKVSRRSHQAVGGDIGARAAAATPTAIRMPGLTPAKIIVFRGTGTTTQTRSEITNLEYQKRAGASYTHAFGGSSATEKEFEAQEILLAAFADLNTSVSFTPERLYQGR